MPIVYEHWNPETNECFYVGASISPNIKQNFRRANTFSRANEKYKNIINFLKTKNKKPIVKIVAVYEDKESAFCLEKMRIIYHRSMSMQTLANLSPGGRGYSSGIEHPLFGKPGIMRGRKGAAHPAYGIKKENQHRFGKYAKRGPEHPNYGKEAWNKGIPGLKGSKNGMWGKPGPMLGRKGPNHPSYGKPGAPKKKGLESPHAKLTAIQAEEIKRLLRDREITQKQIAKLYGIHRTLVGAIKSGKAYA